MYGAPQYPDCVSKHCVCIIFTKNEGETRTTMSSEHRANYLKQDCVLVIFTGKDLLDILSAVTLKSLMNSYLTDRVTNRTQQWEDHKAVSGHTTYLKRTVNG